MMGDSVTTGRVRDLMLSRKGIIVSRWVLVGLLVVSFLLVVLVLLVDAGRVAGQTIDPVALEALYNLDFDVAEGKFLQLTEEDPTNPTYWNLLASSIWLKIVYQQEKMNLVGYTGSSLGNAETETRLRRTLARCSP